MAESETAIAAGVRTPYQRLMNPHKEINKCGWMVRLEQEAAAGIATKARVEPEGNKREKKLSWQG